jgi:hypothetical protein
MTPYRRVHTTCREAQVVKAELPAGELEFDGQSLHKADPADALYFPATHAVQIPPSGPVHPVLQVQFFKAALPAGDLAFDGQTLHVELADAPTAAEYVPVPQSVQRTDPVEALYFPPTQAVHVPVSV